MLTISHAFGLLRLKVLSNTFGQHIVGVLTIHSSLSYNILFFKPYSHPSQLLSKILIKYIKKIILETIIRMNIFFYLTYK